MNRSTTQIRLLVAVLVSILSFSFAKAEASDSNLPDSKGWYLGVDGGLPFGLSTFSSFGHDKTHLGWAAGIYGGYRFNPIFSAELSARYGEVNLSAQDCCVERNYWLGSDGMLYKASVLGMDSWEYAQLKSHVRMGWYGARVHVNLLGLLRNTAHSRWTVAVSPHLYAVTTCADIQTLADHAEVMKGSTRWHLGYGASLQAGYQLTSNLNLGIYSGLTRLSGERMDGMPEHLHKNNFVWESGIRLGISFSKKKNKIVETPSVPQTEILHQDTILSENVNQKEKETVDKAETKVVEQDIKEPVKVTFPVIYFSFNRITIRPSEVSKLKSILHILKENPEMKVTVTKRQRGCQQTHLPPASTSPEDLACEERYCSKPHLGSRKGKRRFQNCPKSPPSRDYKSSSVTHKTR